MASKLGGTETTSTAIKYSINLYTTNAY